MVDKFRQTLWVAVESIPIDTHKEWQAAVKKTAPSTFFTFHPKLRTFASGNTIFCCSVTANLFFSAGRNLCATEG